jgi:hypothetical protein
MPRVPLLSGITADETAEFKTSRPVNLEIVPIDNKIAKAQFRMTAGATEFAEGPGVDRGGIFWNDAMHRVMGTKLVSISEGAVVAELGDVGGTGPVTFDYSFDRLGIRSGEKLFYWNGAVLTEVTDQDLGPVLDFMWIDGYFMTTDGEAVVVTELNDPTSILPLKYGSAEEDPDAVTGLIKVRNEPYVLGRNTIQVLKNVGGNGFPFTAVRGASIPVGCVSPSAKCLFLDSFAFVGSARGEALGVYIAGQGTASKISDRAIDDELAKVEDPTQIILENRSWRGERRLLVHLPDKTLVFQANATRDLEEPVWPSLKSGRDKPYRLRNAVLAYGKVFVGDTESALVGELTETVATHFRREGRMAVRRRADLQRGQGLHPDQRRACRPAGARAAWRGRPALHVDDPRRRELERRAGDSGRQGGAAQYPAAMAAPHQLSPLGRPRFRGYSAGLPGIAACEVQATPLAA